MRPCADIRSWVDAVVAGRPYDDVADLLAAADAPAPAPGRGRRSRRRSPTIRGSASGTRAPGPAPSTSGREQAGVDPHDADVQRRLAAGNAAYEERFDRIFLVRAAGRSAEEILALLEERLTNDPDTELAVTAGQLREIAAAPPGRTRLMSTLSTHVLDAVLGVPAVGIRGPRRPSRDEVIDGGVDGRRRPDPVRRRASSAGAYALIFETGAWFADADRDTFFPVVGLAFHGRRRPTHHHVALLLSPYSYTTYRGS